MAQSIVHSRSILVVLGLLAIGFFLYTSIDVAPGKPTHDQRPAGTVEDIEALAESEDVNILFVLVDTLRANRMSVYGYERDTTPFLRELAKSSLLFDRHVAQSSWTKSSMASIWSGLNPLRVGITKFDHTLSRKPTLPAEILADAGFRNVALYRNGWVHGYFGFDQGFDKYYRPMGNRNQRGGEDAQPNEIGFAADEEMITEAIEFLRIHGHTSRWFLYLHMMDLHEYVYDEESAKFGTNTPDLYDNSMLRTDWLISKLYEYLQKTSLDEKTILVILSDHGEAFGERGFEGHAREVLPETTDTPLLISLPFALDGPVVVESPTSNVDVWPTLLDLLGLPLPEDIDGRSRVPEILAAASGEALETADDEPIVSYLDQNWGQNIVTVDPAISVLQGEYRFVSGKGTGGMPFEALLSTEDGERRNRIKDFPEIADRLREIAKAQLEAEPAFGIESVEMDEMQLDQLRALGYELP